MTQSIEDAGIRAVVTSASEASVNYDQQVIPYHLKIPALDYESFSLEPYFEQAADFIDSSLAATNVLVHCMAGMSRSVSFTIAYLMKYRGMGFDDALNLVRSRRLIVQIDVNLGQPERRLHRTAETLQEVSQVQWQNSERKSE